MENDQREVDGFCSNQPGSYLPRAVKHVHVAYLCVGYFVPVLLFELLFHSKYMYSFGTYLSTSFMFTTIIADIFEIPLPSLVMSMPNSEFCLFGVTEHFVLSS